MRRTLKRACILRPLHLLRLAVSAAGGARLRSPLQGSLLGGSRLRSLPCKGRWMRRSAQTEGCIAGWRRRCPAKFGRTLPRLRRGRCWHRPANPAVPRASKRRAKTPALHCGREREVMRKRQAFAVPVGGPMQASAPTQGVAGARNGPPRSAPRCGDMLPQNPRHFCGFGGGRRRPPFAPAQTPASRISPLRKAMSAPAGRSRRARVRRASSGAISTHCTRRLSQVVQYRRRLSAHRTTLYTV